MLDAFRTIVALTAILCVTLPEARGHESQGPQVFQSVFTFGHDPRVYVLNNLNRAKDTQRWNGWICSSKRKLQRPPGEESLGISLMVARCTKLNAFVELSAKCHPGVRQVQEATGGSRLEHVTIRITCDGGKRFEAISQNPSVPSQLPGQVQQPSDNNQKTTEATVLEQEPLETTVDMDAGFEDSGF